MSKFKKSEIDLRKSHTEIATECGYCKSPNFVQAGYTYNKITPEHYTHLINQGWCRYGDYYYKPNVKRSCCKIFAHRLDITKFTLRPSQKKVIKKWENFLIQNKKIIPPINNHQKNTEDSIIINILEEGRQEEQEIINIPEETPESTHNIVNISDDQIFLQRSIEHLIETLTTQGNSLTQELPMKKIGKMEIREQSRQKIKLLKANSRKYGEYSTNLLMLVFAENRSKLTSAGIKTIQAFVEVTGSQIKKILGPQVKPFQVYVQQNGYISFSSSPKKMPVFRAPNPTLTKQTCRSKMGNVFQKIFGCFRKRNSQPKKVVSLFNENTERDIPRERFYIRMDRAGFDREAFEVYKKHCDGRHEGRNKTEEIFKSFFCVNPYEYETLISKTKERTTMEIGAFHMKYYLENKLIAVGVLDIAPTCMQSIYFFYDPAFSYLSPGVVGALKEIEFMKKMQIYFPQFKYYHLGGYIQTCKKVQYKVDYEPAELLCPETYTWVRFNKDLKNDIDHGKVRLARKNVHVVKDQDLSKIDIDKFILKNIELNSRRILGQELDTKIYKTLLEFFREAAVYSGKRLLAETNFRLKMSSEK